MPSRPTTNRMLSSDWALDSLYRDLEQIDTDVRMFQRAIDNPSLADPHKLCDLVESLHLATVDRDRVLDGIAGLRR